MTFQPRPLCLLVHPSIADWPEWEEFRTKGHRVDVDAQLKWHEYDAVLAPSAWRMSNFTRKYLSVAVQEARKVRYPSNHANRKATEVYTRVAKKTSQSSQKTRNNSLLSIQGTTPPVERNSSFTNAEKSS